MPRRPEPRSWLVFAGVIALSLVVFGALQLAAVPNPLAAQGAATAPAGCSPNDSGCMYCAAHPTASICPKAATAAAGGASTAATSAATAAATTAATAPAAAATAAASAATAGGSPAPAGCSPNDSACVYCTAHPTASICSPKATTAAATTAATVSATAAPTASATTAPSAAASPAATAATAAGSSSASFTVVASGLNNPRGLKFGPDGNIYVAEAGTGGTTSTVGTCAQVPPPVGPYTGSTTGSRISMITPAGARTTVVDNLPSAQDAIPPNPDVIGAADVAFLGNTLYGLESGAGCSHGVSSIPNNVFKANADGSWTQVADLSAFLQAHPVAKPNAADFEPDGTWYSMVASGGNLYAVEPNHGELDKVSPDGTVTRVADISATEGHSVPTSVAVGPDGNFYVGNLFHFPIASGDAEILKITPSGQVTHYAMGLTAVVGLAFDSKGNLFALELSAAPPAGSPAPLVPGTGRVVEVSSSGTITQVAGGLTLPGAMTIGPDNAIYVTNNGSGAPGSGQVVRIAHP